MKQHHKSIASTLSLTLVGICLTGCASYKIPPIQGDLIEYNRKDPVGGTTIVAKGVSVTPEAVMAEEVTWDTTYPQFAVHVRVVNYRRTINPSAKKP